MPHGHAKIKLIYTAAQTAVASISYAISNATMAAKREQRYQNRLIRAQELWDDIDFLQTRINKYARCTNHQHERKERKEQYGVPDDFLPGKCRAAAYLRRLKLYRDDLEILCSEAHECMNCQEHFAKPLKCGHRVHGVFVHCPPEWHCGGTYEICPLCGQKTSGWLL